MKITNAVLGGVDPKDAPDYVDAYIESCDIDGNPATEEQINAISSEIVHELVLEMV